MTCAGPLNGIVLNGTIRFTFMEPTPVLASAEAQADEPTRARLASGSAHAESKATGHEPTRIARVAGGASSTASAMGDKPNRVDADTDAFTFAVMLNGFALNDSTRYTHLYPAGVAGEAAATGHEPTRIRLGYGQGEARADIANLEPLRTAYSHADAATGEADAPGIDAYRVTRVNGERIEGTASTSPTDGVRLAFLDGQAEADAEASPGEMERHAYVGVDTTPVFYDRTLNGSALGSAWWSQQRVIAEADTTLDYTVIPTRVIEPGQPLMEGSATLVPLAYDLTRWMTPRMLRPRAQSYNNEGRTRRIKVRQKYSTGTAICRAFSRGIHSATLAASIDGATAEGRLRSEHVYIARDAGESRATAEAFGAGATWQQYAPRGTAVAEAKAFISPDITYHGDNFKTAYAGSAATASASISPTAATRKPMVVGVRLPAWCDFRVTQIIERDAHGVASALGASVSDPLEALTTHTVWQTGRVQPEAQAIPFEPTALRKVVTEAYAEASGIAVPWHWPAVEAVSEESAEASLSAAGARRLAKPTTAPRVADGTVNGYAIGASPWVSGRSAGDADAHDTARKLAYVSSRAVIDGAAMGDAVEVTRDATADPLVISVQARPFHPRVTVNSARFDRAQSAASATASYRNARVKLVPDPISPAAQMLLPWSDLPQIRGAHLYRWIVSSPSRMQAGGGASRNAFKINADEHASLWRTIRVAGSERTLTVTSSPREYRVA